MFVAKLEKQTNSKSEEQVSQSIILLTIQNWQVVFMRGLNIF